MIQNRRFYGIQALRGLAAIMVVTTHSALVMRDKMGYAASWQFPAGAAGVDIFFCISGFVMTMSFARYETLPSGWRMFLWHRLLRIVPLYWLLTTVKLALLLAKPDLGTHFAVMPWHTIASYLFIPAWNADHETLPLVQVGWTLNCEMFFYCLVAACLALEVRVIKWLTCLLLPLAALGFFRTTDWGAVSVLIRPLLAEFVFGMWVAHIVLRGKSLPPVAACLGAACALFIIIATNHLGYFGSNIWRLPCWGGASALLLFSVASLEAQFRPAKDGFTVLLGDASYSIYLFQGFVLSALSQALTRIHLPFPLTLFLFVATSVICGIVLHKTVEKPMGHTLKELPPCRS
jgi:exopolysaccharide production protein ExoZ